MKRHSDCYFTYDFNGDGHGAWLTQGPPASFKGDSYIPLICNPKAAGALVQYDYEEPDDEGT